MAYYFRAPGRATNCGVQLARHGMDHYRGSDYYTFTGRPAAAPDTAAWSIMTKLLGFHAQGNWPVDRDYRD